MGFLGLGEDAHLQLKMRRVKNIEGLQRRRVLRGGRWRRVADESQVVNNELEALRSHIPLALGDCVDLAKFVLEAISEINIRHLDENGNYTCQFSTFALCGYVCA
ncbi:unnamed protein product [Malus baccata var. baccata]